MYLLEEAARQRQQEMLKQAQLHRAARRAHVLNRSRRQVARAERRMSRARVKARLLRQQLEVEA